MIIMDTDCHFVKEFAPLWKPPTCSGTRNLTHTLPPSKFHFLCVCTAGLIAGDSFSRLPSKLSSEVDNNGQTKKDNRNYPGIKGQMVFIFLPPYTFSLLESIGAKW